MEKESGITLLELLITIVMLSILLAVGVPSLQDFIKNNRITGQANDLAIAIQLARSEAVKRGTGGIICASDDEATCSNSDDWSTGWIVYTDVDQDGNLNLDASGDGSEDCVNDDCLIRTRATLPRSTLDGAGNSSINFLPNGLVNSGTDITLTLTSDDCYKKQVREITITQRGHTYVRTLECP
ncbi:MAG: GspH/FimT family pseudopilin [Pseudomonadota bacterium]